MRISAACVLGLLSGTCFASRAYNIKQILLDKSNNWSSNTTIAFPGEDLFFASTERWNTYKAPSYSAVISPADEADVVKAVKLARHYSIPFLTTGGRHAYGTTVGRLQGGLAVDLSHLKTVKVDRESATLIVGGGVRMAEIQGPVHEAGYELQVGSCSCPGIVGVTIGGGLSFWQGLHGTLSDALVSVRLITAKGRLIEVSEKSNPDLFWGIRGAGANFGIITSATYKLQPQTNNDQILLVDVAFPAEANATYYKLVKSYSQAKTPLLSFSSVIIYDAASNSPQIVATWIYLGPEDEGMKVLAPLFDLGPVLSAVNVVSWSEVYAKASFGNDAQNCVPNSIHNPYAANLRNVTAPVMSRLFESMATFYQQYPGARGSVAIIESLNNKKMNEIPDATTAFPWRDTESYLFALFSWQPGDTQTEDAANKLGRSIRSDFAANSGYEDLAVYINNAHGDEKLEQIYGKRKLPRLASLKKTWDPDNVFKYHHPLPTVYP